MQLKPIHKEAIEDALHKAVRYRLLNEPQLTESICLDILALEPDNHDAIINMLLAVSDQFGGNANIDRYQAHQLVDKLNDEYERHYYSGIICERKGTATLDQGTTGSRHNTYEWLREAMDHYERAEAIRPEGNDEAILRWNTCLRVIQKNHLEAREEEPMDLMLE